jgi:RNA 2'-phosphotransferase, Tpt1 / KptA family
VHDEELLKPILDPFQFEEVVHGTYLKVVEPIMAKGLCKMARNHIRKFYFLCHCVLDMAIGMPGKKGVISGMRQSCEVVVEINIVKAVKDGVPFFISENLVILSPGVSDEGFLPPKYFRQVLNLKANDFIYQAPFDYIVVYDFECQCEENTKLLTFNVCCKSILIHFRKLLSSH